MHPRSALPATVILAERRDSWRPPLGDSPLLLTTSTQSALIRNGIGLERAVTGTRGIDAPESARRDDLERYSHQRFGPFIAHHVHVPAA